MLTDDDMVLIRKVVREEAGPTQAAGIEEVATFLRAQPPGDVGAAELFARYVSYLEGSGREAGMTRQRFGRRTMATGLVDKRHTRTGDVYTILASANRFRVMTVTDARRSELRAIVRHLHERRTPEQRRWAAEEAQLQLNAGAHGEDMVLAEATLALVGA